MTDKIKPEVLEAYKKIEENGYQVYLVGGSVRDLLLNREIKDWDLTTNATPEQIQQIFPDSFYDNNFGTVGIVIARPQSSEAIPSELEPKQTNPILEVTTYRSESEYTDRRHPEKVEWGKTIEEDLARRDFTINAIALKLNPKPYPLNPILIDPYNGQIDLKNHLVRAVGNPNERFKEDALRLMRAIRIATQLEFEIEKNTWDAIVTDANLIKHVSGERIRDELLKILSSKNSLKGIHILDASGILQIILPELELGKGVSQVRPGRHHTTDVFTHNVLSMNHCPTTDPIVKLAALLHDVGKPLVAGVDENGYIIFYNHEVAGAKMAREISDRLHLSKKQREKIVTLIRYHMFTVDENITDSAVRRFIRKVGLENVVDMIDLRIGDRLGSGTQTAESWRLKKFKERIEQQLNPPFSVNDLAIDGNDIMQELNLKPGPKIGQILNTLFEEVDEDLTKNTKEFLMKRIKEIAT